MNAPFYANARWASIGRRGGLALTALICSAPSAHAYLDPGTGSMILQAIAAAIISIGVFWRGLLAKLRMMFSRQPTTDATDKEK